MTCLPPVCPSAATVLTVCVCVCVQHPTALCPPEYMVCFLHRLMAAVRSCWDDSCRKSPGSISAEG